MKENKELVASKIRGFIRITYDYLESFQKECPSLGLDPIYICSNIFYFGRPTKNAIEWVKKIIDTPEYKYKEVKD